MGSSGDVITVQEDAHEFVLKLFDDSLALDSLFGSHLTSRAVCDTCGARGVQKFWDDNCLTVGAQVW